MTKKLPKRPFTPILIDFKTLDASGVCDEVKGIISGAFRRRRMIPLTLANLILFKRRYVKVRGSRGMLHFTYAQFAFHMSLNGCSVVTKALHDRANWARDWVREANRHSEIRNALARCIDKYRYTRGGNDKKLTDRHLNAMLKDFVNLAYKLRDKDAKRQA